MPEPTPRSYPGVYRRHRTECDHIGTAEAPCSCPWAFVAEVRRKGRRMQETGSGFATKTKAVKARAAAMTRLGAMEAPIDKRRTVEGAFEQWLAEQLATGELRPSTGIGYAGHGRNYIAPYFGHTKLADLTSADYVAFTKYLALDRHLSPATAARVTATARSFLRTQWVEGGALTADVTSTRTSKPKRKRQARRAAAPRIHTWSADELGRVISWMLNAGERLAPAIAIAGLTGIRRGELVGLSWLDVSLKRQQLTVRQQLLQLGRELVPSAPKSEASAGRVVDFGDTAATIFELLRERQDRERSAWGSDYQEHALVLSREDGRPVTPETLTKGFPRAVRRFNTAQTDPAMRVAVIRWHDLRHAFASAAITAGVPITTVSKLLGHATPAITATVYAHVLGDAGALAAAAVSGAVTVHFEAGPSQIPSIAPVSGDTQTGQ